VAHEHRFIDQALPQGAHMKVPEFVSKVLGLLPPPITRLMDRTVRTVPILQGAVDEQVGEWISDVARSQRAYRDRFKRFDHLPAQGLEQDEILAELEAMQATERPRWEEGYASGAVYHGDPHHVAFLNKVYALYSQSNPLHFDLWPSAAKFEAEIVAMAANMLGAGEAAGEICGTVTSGGTESILLAMKAYRDWSREKKGITRPEIVVPTSAHAAFEKASQYFNIKLVRVPVGPDFTADVAETEKRLTRNTIAIVGSAPSFPHGVIDPIPDLARLAAERGIGFHTDACLGGFILPWAASLGYPAPAFDFRLPGVTSISADTHKYGYAAKGTSVVLYRGLALRHSQYFTSTDWPGGLYFSPTFAGSRPGALVAACWAAMLSMGERGYVDATRRILETAAYIKGQIAKIPELSILGDPLWVIAMASEKLDIYRILDFMTERKWSLNGLHRPPAMHLCVTLRNAQPGVADRFLADLRDAVAFVKTNPAAVGGMAPIYGMAGTFPLRGVVREVLRRFLDQLYVV
jgi:sphinganine-1-phosphate aldolase